MYAEQVIDFDVVPNVFAVEDSAYLENIYFPDRIRGEEYISHVLQDKNSSGTNEFLGFGHTGILGFSTATVFAAVSSSVISSFERKGREMKREAYYVRAIKNLLKRANYLDLSLQLAEELISEEEFDELIEENPDEYVIQVQGDISTDDLNIIGEIVKKLDLDLDSDEIEAIFGINLEKLG